MSRSFRPRYHASVLSGWANDPNGTVVYNGQAHLFFQHYPHRPSWGTMHWGHFTTSDFIHWEQQPIALTPDRDYEALCGCCSGTAIERDGALCLLYTAAQPDLQRQCMAVSRDGLHFEKNPENPIITARDLSPEIAPADFRDPKVFRRDGSYWLIAGARVAEPGKRAEAAPSAPSGGQPVRSPSAADVSRVDPEASGYGNLVLLKSPDLRHWSYVGRLLRPQEGLEAEYLHLNGVYECPDYFTLDGYEVLLSSPQNLPRMGLAHQNIHSGLYMLGALDYETGRFRVDALDEVDCGFDFYAAQTLRAADGRRILIAWKEMWDRNFPTQAEGWAGTYTLPRELRVRDGRLIQQPVREIEQFRKNPRSLPCLAVKDGSFSPRGFGGAVTELRLTLEPGTAERAGVSVFCGREHETRIYYDRAEGVLVFDRSRSGLPLTGKEPDVERRVCPVEHPERIDLRLFLDVSSLEVFAEGGLRVLTGNVFPDEGDTGVRFFARGGEARFRDIEEYDIEV